MDKSRCCATAVHDVSRLVSFTGYNARGETSTMTGAAGHVTETA